MKRSWFLTAAFIFSIMLSACGGGGGGNTNTSPSVPNDNGNTDTPPPVFSDYTSVAQGEDPPAPPVVVTPPVAPPVVPPADPPVIVVPPPDPDVPSGAWNVSGTTLGLSVYDGSNLHVISRQEQTFYMTKFAANGAVIRETLLHSNMPGDACRAVSYLNGYTYAACSDLDGKAWIFKTSISSGETEEILAGDGLIVDLEADVQAGKLHAIYENGGQWLMELNQNGEVIKSTPKPGSQFEMQHIAEGSDGIYIAGRIMLGGSFDRIWVAKYAKSDLSQQWSIQYRPFDASEALDRTHDIAVSPSGMVFVTGDLVDKIPGTFQESATNIAFEMNPANGSIVTNWTATKEFGRSIQFDSLGNMYSIDYVLSKFNPSNGTFAWTSLINGNYLTLVGDTLYTWQPATPMNPNPSKILRTDTATGLLK